MRCVLLLLAMLPSIAWGGPHRDAVLDLLNAYESVPSRADLVAIGDDVDAELMAIADDGSVPTSRRGRAVTALQHVPNPQVRAWLERRLERDDSSLLRRKAAWALAKGFGEGAIPALGRALDDADAQLRIAAAQALGSLDSASARATLKGRLAQETEPAVTAAIRKSMGNR